MVVARSRPLTTIGIVAACLAAFALGWFLLKGLGSPESQPDAVPSDPPEIADADAAPEVVSDRADRSTRGQPEDEERRIAMPASVLSGAILDPSGSPVEGAILSWTTMLEDQRSPDQRWGDLDHERIRAATVSTTTDEDGNFTFEAPPSEIEGPLSVVWISHPSWQACSVVLPREWEEWVWPESLELVAGEEVEVVVVSGTGERCPLATVLQHLIFTGSHPDLTEVEIDARRFYWRELSTDVAGSALAHPGSGKINLVARAGERVSKAWLGTPEETVTLTLLDSFVVSGLVRTDKDVSSFSGTRVAIGFRREPESKPAWFTTSMQVRSDGSFGPFTYPLADGAQLTSWVGLGDVIEQYDDRPAPRPGERVHLVLDVSVGEQISIRVEDLDGLPIEGATVFGFPLRIDTFVDVGIEAKTDEEGQAVLRGLPPGRVAFRASKVGYAIVDRWVDPPPAPQIVLPWNGEEELRIILPPSVTIEGYVVMDWEPVPEFTLAYWSSYERQGHSDFSDEEGRFKIVVEKGIEVSLMASTEGLPQSETVTVTAGEADSLEVELTIPPPRLCRGQIVDATTGEPHPSASLIPWTTTGNSLFRKRGDSFTTDFEGRFEVPGLYPGSGGLEISAEGYSTIYTTVSADHGEIIEYGIIALEPLASAVIRVVGLEGDPTRCRVWQNITKPKSPVPLGADGTLRMESLRPAQYTFFLQLPDRSIRTTKHLVLPTREAEVFFRLGGEAELGIHVERGDGRFELKELSVRVSTSTTVGDPETLEIEVPEAGKTVLRGLNDGPAVVELLGPEGEPLQSLAMELIAGILQEVRLTPGAGGRRLRLLDGDGTPHSTTGVRIALPGDASGWCPRIWTDVDGVLELGAIEASSILLFANPTAGELAFGVQVELDPDPSKITEVRLETPARLVLQLLEEGEPCTGVSMQFTHSALPPGQSGPTCHSDETGLTSPYQTTEGRYLVTPESPRYWRLTTAINVVAGKGPYRVELYSLGTIRVRALSESGTPAAGVELELRHSALGASVLDWIERGVITSCESPLMTGSDGELELSGVPRGSYEWSARYPSGVVLQGTANLPPEGAIVVEIQP